MIATLAQDTEIASQVERIVARAARLNKNIDISILRAAAMDGLSRAREAYSPARGVPLVAFISVCVKRAVIGSVRQERRRSERFEPWPTALDGSLVDFEDGREPAPGAVTDYATLRNQLYAMPDGLRRAVEMRFIDGLTFEAMAKALAVSTEGARRRVASGVRYLRETLQI